MSIHMKSVNVVPVIMIVSLLQSCKNGPTQPSQSSQLLINTQVPVTPVYRTMPASQIMAAEGITSLHYLWYDSSVVGTRADSAFTLLDEDFVDSIHVKIIQYNRGQSYYTSVYDMVKNVAWYYEGNTVSYMPEAKIPVVVESSIQSTLGSSLVPPVTYLRTEYVADKLCDVFQDSTGYMEWIWRDHLLPIQTRNVTQLAINTARKQILEINTVFSESIFSPP